MAEELKALIDTNEELAWMKKQPMMLDLLPMPEELRQRLLKWNEDCRRPCTEKERKLINKEGTEIARLLVGGLVKVPGFLTSPHSYKKNKKKSKKKTSKKKVAQPLKWC